MLMLDLHPPIAVNIAVLFERNSDLGVEPGQLHHLLKLRICLRGQWDDMLWRLSEDVTLNMGRKTRMRMTTRRDPDL